MYSDNSVLVNNSTKLHLILTNFEPQIHPRTVSIDVSRGQEIYGSGSSKTRIVNISNAEIISPGDFDLYLSSHHYWPPSMRRIDPDHPMQTTCQVCGEQGQGDFSEDENTSISL